jgi:predicted TIM-barrel fold metal-dependent hydrolase
VIIDFHIHACPEELVRPKLGPGDSLNTLFIDGKTGDTALPLRFTLEKHIELMDYAGVDLCVISSGEGMRENLANSRLVNDRLKEAEERYPGRIKGMGHTPPLGGPEAMAELERCSRELGYKGAAMHSVNSGKEVDDPALWPFYEKVQQLGMFLFIHPGSAVYSDYLDYDLGRSVGREGHLMAVMVRLINGGVLDDFPGLTVVMSHLGGGFAFWMTRILSYQNKEFWGTSNHPRHGKKAKRPFREYLDRMYFDTGGLTGDINPVKMTLMEISPKNILFGTDYPLEIREAETVKRFVDKIRELPLSRQEIDGILGENARPLLGI